VLQTVSRHSALPVALQLLFYGKVNYGKIKTLYAVLQPPVLEREKELCSEHSDSH
jgi:hypothetical protein